MTPLLINNKPVVLDIGPLIHITEEDLVETDKFTLIKLDLSGIGDPYMTMKVLGGQVVEEE
jgi:hypothetical protein